MATFLGLVEMLCLLLLIQNLQSNVGCIKSEREALLNFKLSLIDSSNRLFSWTGEDCCSWEGIACSNTTGHVIKLDLHSPFSLEADGWEKFSQSFLGGEINISLLNLMRLNYLDLSGNDFSGLKIPKFLGSLKQLKYLNLSYSLFTGEIPHHLGNLSNLQFLDLGHNYNLIVDNLLWLATLFSLKFLDLYNANLSRVNNWLDSINMLPSLKELHLLGCELQGIPPFLHVNFTSLMVLDLSYNSLNSTIPLWLLSNISNIQHLDLSWSNLQGSIPSEIGNLDFLEVLDLSGNELEGEIPETLSNLCNLQKLQMGYNKLIGEISRPIGSLCVCAKNRLEYLSLSSNYLHGSIPASIGKLSSLKELELGENFLNGSIPETVGQLSSLEDLNVRYNFLDGMISDVHFLKLRSLTVLSMDGNS